MELQVDVRSCLHREGTKADKKWAMEIATVIVTNPDGSEAVGELVLPKGHPPVVRGPHVAKLAARQFKGAVTFEVSSMHPVLKK